ANNTTEVPIQVGSGPPPTCPVYTSTDVPKSLPDLGSATSSLAVPTTGPLSRVRIVDLHGTHTYVSDLEFHLRSPAGTDVNVMNRVCGSFDNFFLDLSDLASTAITCPPTDQAVHRPSNPLSPFIGEESSGTWHLDVFDRAAQDVGTLDGWGLEICPLC